MTRIYGQRSWVSHRPPLDELILTILSQHTSDGNCARAFESLWGQFGSWRAIADAPVAEITNAIASGGLARLKAPRIKAILQRIRQDSNALSLDYLAEQPPEETRRWLIGLSGVGPKTAACVQLFSLGQPAMPVDTHVLRVSRRLGLVPPTADVDETQHQLERLLASDRDRIYSFHLNLIDHGRAVCRVRRPHCEQCPLADCCDAYRRSRPHHA